MISNNVEETRIFWVGIVLAQFTLFWKWCVAKVFKRCATSFFKEWLIVL
jgi:hypothetical protein